MSIFMPHRMAATPMQMMRQSINQAKHFNPEMSPMVGGNNLPYSGAEINPLDHQIAMEMKFHSYQIKSGNTLFEQNRQVDTCADVQNINLYKQELNRGIDQSMWLNDLGGTL